MMISPITGRPELANIPDARLAGCRDFFFDLDGTLVDSRAAILGAYQHVFRSVAHAPFPFDGDSDLGQLLAMRPVEVFAQALGSREDECVAAYHEHYRDCSGYAVKAYEGAKALLEALVDKGHRIGIVTNKASDRAILDLARTGVVDVAILCTLVGSEHTVKRKPHPAPLLLALERCGAIAARSVYVGDGPHDMSAARAAGMAGVGASYGYYGADALREAGAQALIGSPMELVTLTARD